MPRAWRRCSRSAAAGRVRGSSGKTTSAPSAAEPATVANSSDAIAVPPSSDRAGADLAQLLGQQAGIGGGAAEHHKLRPWPP